MKFLFSLSLIILIFSSSFCFSGERGTVFIERERILERIQCNKEMNTPAGDGLGSIWGCYNINEDVRLWINGQSIDTDLVSNIKISVVNWHGSKMDITGQIWSKIIAEEYAKSKADLIKHYFQKCPVEKTYKSGSLEILVKCQKGPKADEHLLIVYFE